MGTCSKCQRTICKYHPNCTRHCDKHRYIEYCHGCSPCTEAGCECKYQVPELGGQGGMYSDFEKCTNCNHSSTHKPVCKYGSDCYRKNAQHFKDFIH